VLNASNCFLPVLTIEVDDSRRAGLDVEIVQCSYVHRIEIWRTSRPREDMYAADDTEVMFGLSATEAVGSELILATEEPEPGRLYRVMQGSLLAADGAVALNNALDRAFDLEAHCTAMT
jgi:hypothetical protein